MRDWIRLLLKCFVWVVLALSLAAPIWFLWQRSHPMNAKPESIGAFRKSDNASSLSAMSNSYRLNSAAGTLSSEQQALQDSCPCAHTSGQCLFPIHDHGSCPDNDHLLCPEKSTGPHVESGRMDQYSRNPCSFFRKRFESPKNSGSHSNPKRDCGHYQ